MVVSCELGLSVSVGIQLAGIHCDPDFREVLDDVVLDSGHLGIVVFDDEVNSD